MDDATPGTVLEGRYRLISKLGEGGYGRVWKAHDQRLDRPVAVKEVKLPPSLTPAERKERIDRADHEARNAAKLRGVPGIVTVHDVFVTGDRPWIVMELIEGRSLADHLEALPGGRLAAADVVSLAQMTLRALGEAHVRGLVHRDVKPANIMITLNGDVLLTDFGIAVHRDDTRLTSAGMFIGSAAYMAPERVRGDQAGAESDLFSLGVVLYEAVTGVSPFRRPTLPETMAAVMNWTAPQPMTTAPLALLITQLMMKRPENRPTVARALAMIAQVPNGTPTRTSTWATAATPAPPPSSTPVPPFSSTPAPPSSSTPPPLPAPVPTSTPAPPPNPTPAPTPAPTAAPTPSLPPTSPPPSKQNLALAAASASALALVVASKSKPRPTPPPTKKPADTAVGCLMLVAVLVGGAIWGSVAYVHHRHTTANKAACVLVTNAESGLTAASPVVIEDAQLGDANAIASANTLARALNEAAAAAADAKLAADLNADAGDVGAVASALGGADQSALTLADQQMATDDSTVSDDCRAWAYAK